MHRWRATLCSLAIYFHADGPANLDTTGELDEGHRCLPNAGPSRYSLTKQVRLPGGLGIDGIRFSLESRRTSGRRIRQRDPQGRFYGCPPIYRVRAACQEPFVLQYPSECLPFCLIFRPRDSEAAITAFKVLEWLLTPFSNTPGRSGRRRLHPGPGRTTRVGCRNASFRGRIAGWA